MFNIDFSDFERMARKLELVEREIPFALANAMSRAAQRTKDALVNETWPRSVTVRNRGFMRASLKVVPAKARDFREGRGMRAEIFDDLGHVDLERFAVGGGVKRPTRGSNLAIPTSRVRRGAGGAVVRGQKPRNLKRVVKKGGLLFQAEGRGKNSRLRLMYKLQPSVRVNRKVDFYGDFNRLMRAEIYKAFPIAVANVLRRAR